MIIRSIKMNPRQVIIPESSVYQQQDHTIQETSNQKRTLNPQLPISDTIVSKEQNFFCQPSEPFFQKTKETKQAQERSKIYLSAEKPLPLQVGIAKVQQKQMQNQELTKKSHQEVRRLSFGVSRLRQRSIGMKRNVERISKFVKEQPLKHNQDTRLEKKINDKAIIIKKWKKILPQATEVKQAQQPVVESQKVEEQNVALKSKFSKSVVRSRLSETLNKFRYHKQQNVNNISQRYAYTNSLDEKSQNQNHLNTAVSMQTDKNSQKIIFQHIKSKADQLRTVRGIKKMVPGDSESTDQHYSTIFGNFEPPKGSNFQQDISPKGHFQEKQRAKQRITVSYKTTLLQLKEICARQDLCQQQVIIMVPQALSFVEFQENSSQQEIFKAAKRLVNKLNISYKQLNIKKYFNCVVIVCENKAIVSYFSGKIYIGGWSWGQKMGLGLQLTPGKSVYYGQFRKNKREGVGIYKGIKGDLKGGYWRDNHFQGAQAEKINNRLYKRSFFQHEEQDDW